MSENTLSIASVGIHAKLSVYHCLSTCHSWVCIYILLFELAAWIKCAYFTLDQEISLSVYLAYGILCQIHISLLHEAFSCLQHVAFKASAPECQDD